MLADSLAAIFVVCFYTLCFTDYIKQDGVATAHTWGELNALFWGILILITSSLAAFFYVRHRMDKITDQWRMRDEILILLAKDNEPLPSYLFSLERDGYPVFEMVKRYGKLGLLQKYEDYLKSQHVLYHNAVYGKPYTHHNITAEEQKNWDILGEILALPTWKSIALKEEMNEGLRMPATIRTEDTNAGRAISVG